MVVVLKHSPARANRCPASVLMLLCVGAFLAADPARDAQQETKRDSASFLTLKWARLSERVLITGSRLQLPPFDGSRVGSVR